MGCRQNMTGILVAVCLTAAAASAPPEPAAAPNLVRNGSFEEADPANPANPAAWSLSADQKCQAMRDSVGAAGERSLLLHVPKGERWGKCHASQSGVRLSPLTTYRIRLKFRAEGGGQPNVGVTGAGVKADWYLPASDTGGKWLDWEAEFMAGDRVEPSCQVLLHNYHREGKKIWYDDVLLYEVPFAEGGIARDCRDLLALARAVARNTQGIHEKEPDLDDAKALEKPPLRQQWQEATARLSANYERLAASREARTTAALAELRKGMSELRDSVAPFEYLVWTKSCWLGYRRDERPPRLENAKALTLRAAVNETECATFYLSNLTDDIVEFCLGFQPPAGWPEGALSFRTTPVTPPDVVRDRNGQRFGYTTHNERVQGVVEDPLIELNNYGSIIVPPGKTREVWLTLDTRGMTPGEYRQGLTISTMNRASPQRTLSLQCKVHDVALPQRGMPISTFSWNYNFSPANLRDLAEHRFNTFLISTDSFCPKLKGGTLSKNKGPRGEALREGCEVERDAAGNLVTAANPDHEKLVFSHGKALCGYGFFQSFYKTMNQSNLAYMSDGYKQVFRDTARLFVERLKAHGATYDDFYVQTWDEAQGADVEKVIEFGKLMREVDPRVKLVMDVVAVPDEARKMSPYHDIWIMHMGHLLNDLAGWRPFMEEEQKAGKRIGTYSCSTPPLSQGPIGYSRQSAWRVWRLGMEFDWFFADSYVKHWGVAQTPVPSRTWEARRQGLEDYLLLFTLRELVRNAKVKNADAQVTRDAEKALADAPVKAFGSAESYWSGETAEAAANIEAAREMLLVAAERLTRATR